MLPFIVYIVIVLITLPAMPVRCEDPPLTTMYDVVQHFPKVHACNRVFRTGYRVKSNGVREVTLTGFYSRGESAGGSINLPFGYSYKFQLVKITITEAEFLCVCIFNYVNQVDWLDGSAAGCSRSRDGTSVTLTITGKPDPNINQHIPDNVLVLLKKTFDQLPDAMIYNYYCRPTATALRFGCYDFKMECDIFDPLDKQTLCDLVLDYINQDKWLGKLSSSCTSDLRSILEMNIRSDKEPAICRARRLNLL